jgi:16S rRNA processing protein RimM
VADPAQGDQIVAGRVGRPHGLDGSFHVVLPVPALLALGSAVTVAGRSLEIVRRAGTDARPIVRLADCGAREDAEALRGEPLLVERAALPALGEGEWWPHDLEGCDVTDGDRRVGTVRRLLVLPSCEALEVERDGEVEVLVPLVQDAIREVDTEGRRIDVDMTFVEGTPT